MDNLNKLQDEAAAVANRIDAVRAIEAEDTTARDVELIDLRTLRPMDSATVIASVKKTGRVVGVTEAYKPGSFLSELATRIQEELFDWLDAPVARVAAAE